MKKNIISFCIEKPKHRAHRPLFDDDLPFKHKVERAKKGQFQRRSKHRKEIDE